MPRHDVVVVVVVGVLGAVAVGGPLAALREVALEGVVPGIEAALDFGFAR